MTNLSDFLKVKQVRCVKAYGDCLTVGKEYSVLNIRMEVEVRDDEGGRYYWESDHFEPVVDDMPKSAENPLQKMELTPEFEAVEPIFKVGDKVYRGLKGEIRTVERVEIKSLHFAEGGCDFIKHCCHATQENYERLQATFPDIEFEQPSKPLTGIELAKKLIAKGHNYLVVDTVIGIRVLTRLEGNTLIDSNNVRLDELDDITPLNDETGEPLTESVLDE